LFTSGYEDVAPGQRPLHAHRQTIRTTVFVELAAVLLVLVLMLAGLGFAYWSWQANRDFDRRSQIVTAQVTGYRRESCGDSTCYAVQYTFRHTPADGDPRTYTGNAAISSADYDRLVAAEQEATGPLVVSVRYLPEDPQQSKLAQRTSDPIRLLGIVVFIGGIGTMVSASGAISARRRWRTYQEAGELSAGQLVIGEIRAICEHPGSTEAGQHATISITYCFHLPDSPPDSPPLSVQRALLRRDCDDDHPPQVGQQVAVICIDAQTHRAL
jgi:hypothetical protein